MDPAAAQSTAQSLYTSGLTNLLIALTSVITAIGIVWVNVIVAKAKTKVTETATVVIAKATEIGETTKTTLGHVNSAATEMRAIIDSLRHDKEELTRQLNENRQIAAVLAATHAALSLPAGVKLAATVDPAAADRLKAIETNTGDTAAAVRELK